MAITPLLQPPPGPGRRINRLNRISSLVILPLMAMGVLWAVRMNQPASTVAMPNEGTIVVANLRGESLSFIHPANELSTRTLVVPGPPHELVEADGRVYATLGRANAVIEVEPRAPGILRSLALPGEPHGLTVVPSGLLVTLDTGAALVHVDRATFAEVGRDEVGNTPHAVVYGTATASESEAADTTTFANGTGTAGETYVTDTRDDRLRSVGQPARLVATGALPESVALVGASVVTADADAAQLSVYERGSLVPRGVVRLPGRPVRVVTLDARRVAVALTGTAGVAVVDIQRLRVERVLVTSAFPDGICLSPSGTYLAVASNVAATAQIFRIADWRLAGAVRTGEGAGSCLWLPN